MLPTARPPYFAVRCWKNCLNQINCKIYLTVFYVDSITFNSDSRDTVICWLDAVYSALESAMHYILLVLIYFSLVPWISYYCLAGSFMNQVIPVSYTNKYFAESIFRMQCDILMFFFWLHPVYQWQLLSCCLCLC